MFDFIVCYCNFFCVVLFYYGFFYVLCFTCSVYGFMWKLRAGGGGLGGRNLRRHAQFSAEKALLHLSNGAW